MQLIQNVSNFVLRHAARILIPTLFLASAGVSMAGICVSAGIDEPVRFPDGAVREAGTLRLCIDRDFSPVASLHKASIGDENVGFLMSRRDSSEGAFHQPYVMFVRDPDGVLNLHSYALPEAGRMSTYQLQPQISVETSTQFTIATASLTPGRAPAGAY